MKLVALASFLVASMLAAGLTASSPPVVPGTPLENGLLARISFDKPVYLTLETVAASYEYFNPLRYAVTFTPPDIYSVKAGCIDFDGPRIHGGYLTGSITLAPGEAYSVGVYRETMLSPGVFCVDVNGTVGAVEVLQGDLVARISTDRDVYVAGQGVGVATLEVFNSGSTPHSYENFSPLELRSWYRGESPSDRRLVVFVSWMYRSTVVQPGEIHRIWSFSFDAPRAGTLVLDFNGVRGSVEIRGK